VFDIWGKKEKNWGNFQFSFRTQ